MQVTLNSLNLNTGWYSLEDIQFDSSPPLEFSDLSFASADGAKFISSKYTPKTLTLRGRITQSTVALLEAEMDNFKKTLLKDSNINLNFSYANSFRQYVGNVQNLVLSRKHFNITYVPFEITFIAEDPPFAYDISSLSQLVPALSEVFSADGIIGNTYSHTLTMSGTAPPLAKWTYLLDSVSGRIEQMVFKSITTGKQMELNAALSAGDEVIIDQENLDVLLNGFEQQYEGVFPTFNLGGNEFEWQIYGTDEVTSGLYLDQSMTQYPNGAWSGSGFYFGQTFIPSKTAALGKVSTMFYRYYSATTSIIYCYIYNTSGGLPTTLLATSSNTISGADIPYRTNTWVDFNFNQQLTAGITYAIVQYIISTGSSVVAFKYKSADNAYTDGNFVFKGYSGGIPTWYSPDGGNADLAFKTYMQVSTTTAVFDHTSSLKIEQKKRFL